MTTKVADIGPSSHRQEIWFQRGDIRLFALSLGQGDPLVFVHGGLADHRAALYRVGPLASSHRLLLPDLRGSGRSIYAGELSWNCLADDIAALLEHVGLERALVGGTSMGSGVALRFALRHPRRVSGLVLMSPLYPGEDRGLAEAPKVAMRAMAEAGQRALDTGMEALLPLFDALPGPIRSRATEMMLGFDAASVAVTTRFLATNSQPLESVRDLASIDVPVIIVPGTDPEHPAEVATLYAQRLRRPVVLDASSPDLLVQIAKIFGAAHLA